MCHSDILDIGVTFCETCCIKFIQCLHEQNPLIMLSILCNSHEVKLYSKDEIHVDKLILHAYCFLVGQFQ